MGMEWRNGDLDKLTFDVQLRLKDLPGDVAEAVRLSVQDGEKVMEKVIETSTTATGRARADGSHKSHTGSTSPGRVDSGLMINQVNSNSEQDGNTISGKVGWFDPEEYFAIQDNKAFSSISEPMHALLQGFVAAREALISRLTNIARTGKVAK